MSNTYSGDPSVSSKDAVRFILSDKEAPWMFSDEEILYSLSKNSNTYAAAAELAYTQGAKYVNRRDKTVGPLSIKYGEIGDRWNKLAQSLLNRSRKSSGAVAITTQRSTVPHFRLGIHDRWNVPFWNDPKGDQPFIEYAASEALYLRGVVSDVEPSPAVGLWIDPV